MPQFEQELQELKHRVAELTQRIYRLEQSGGAADAPAMGSTPRLEKPLSIPPQDTSPGMPPLPRASTVTPGARETNLEAKIGSEWLNRIGIFALLIGAAYFLKLAFDNNWIGPAGRVSIGLLAGAGLVIWANKIHSKGHLYFSYSLAAVGIGVLYLSLWASSQLYRLLPGAVAFSAMIAVTISAAALALRLNAQILAVVALAGGFATPALLSTGQNRPVELFSYFFVLNLATIVLVTMRPWQRLLAGSFVATTIYYFGWHTRFFTSTQTLIAVGFAAVFGLMFASLPIIRELHTINGRDIGWGRSRTFVAVALLNPVVFFVALFITLEGQTAYRTKLAWSAVALAAFYILIARFARPAGGKQGAAAPAFSQWLHLAIAIGFLTIAMPLRLEAHWVTMAWFAEAAVLLFIGEKLDHSFLRNAAVAALVLGVVRLLLLDNFYSPRLIFNARIATYALAIAVLAAVTIVIRREYGTEHAGYLAASVALNALALVAILGEASHYYGRAMVAADRTIDSHRGTYELWRDLERQRDFVYSGLTMLYGFGLLGVGFWRRSSILRWQALILIFCTVAKVFLYDLSNLTGVLRVLSFIALGILLMAASFIYQRDWLKLSTREPA